MALEAFLSMLSACPQDGCCVWCVLSSSWLDIDLGSQAEPDSSLVCPHLPKTHTQYTLPHLMLVKPPY